MNLTCEILVSKLAFKWVILYRYVSGPAVPMSDETVVDVMAVCEQKLLKALETLGDDEVGLGCTAVESSLPPTA